MPAPPWVLQQQTKVAMTTIATTRAPIATELKIQEILQKFWRFLSTKCYVSMQYNEFYIYGFNY